MTRHPDEVAAELAARYRRVLCLFAARRLADPSLAEDVAQETLRVVLEALRAGRIANPEGIGGFVFQTARNLCMHHGRSARRRGAAFLKLVATDVDPADDALASLLSRERIEQVKQLISALEPAERRLLELFYVEGLGAEEVGRRLSITATAARLRKHRLFAQLKWKAQSGNFKS